MLGCRHSVAMFAIFTKANCFSFAYYRAARLTCDIRIRPDLRCAVSQLLTNVRASAVSVAKNSVVTKSSPKSDKLDMLKKLYGLQDVVLHGGIGLLIILIIHLA